MEQLSLASKTVLSRVIVGVLMFVLVFGVTTQATLAQTVQTNGTNPQTGQPNVLQVTSTGQVTGPTGTQANTVTNGTTGTTATQNTAENITSGIAGCAASLISNAITGVVSTLVAKNASLDNITRVSVTSASDVKYAGDSNGGYPSLNSIGYCIINGVLQYLTSATIDWINSGFDGNPAFVEDPERFFRDIADVEAASFLQQVVGQTTGLNICEPFRLNIVTGLAGTRGPQFQRQISCTFDQMSQALGQSGVNFDYNEYTSGRSQFAGNLNAWYAITQNPQNNSTGAYLMAQEEFNRRLAMRGNTANLDLTLGRGFLSFKKCEPDTTALDSDGNTIRTKGPCKTTTPGTVIEEQLNNRLSSGNNRLVLADQFDQIITALVNQLIKVALNQVLDNSSNP